MRLTVPGHTDPGHAVNVAEVRGALTLLTDPEYLCQVFSIPGYCHANRLGNDVDGLLAAAQQLHGHGAVYVVLNPLLKTRPIREGISAGNRVRASEVAYRRWLFLDVDPYKERGFEHQSATDEEHEQTRRAAEEVREQLSAQGWPAPILIDSGNGYYLLWRTRLDNSAHIQSLIKRFCQSMGNRVLDKAWIDKTVHDAARLMKLPGTWSKKGDDTPERPWRPCRLVYVPDALEEVTAEMIAAAIIGAEKPAPLATPQPHGGDGASALILRAGTARADSYARRARDNECARVAMARAGERNTTLNTAAFALGTLIAGGYLTRGEVEERLTAAARECGLEDDPGCGERGVAATIRSGIDAGLQKPRVIPDNRPPPARPPAADSVPDGESIIVRASRIKPRVVEWLWPGRIPLGKLTTFAGVGGLGKTFVLLEITARVTRGDCWPDSSGECTEPGQVLFISGEDDPDDTLVPRLIEMNADLERVVFLKTEVQDRFTLADLKTLDTAIEQAGPGVRFVAIDPPTAYLGGINDHKNAELRGLLSPLKSWSARHRVATVFNTHVTKPQGNKVEAMMRVMGSVAWVNAVRAAHIFVRDPNDPERRLFCAMKMNLGREKKGLAYKIACTNSLARVEWLGEVDITADEAMNREKRKRDVVAAVWLEEVFADAEELSSRVVWDRAHTETKLSDDAIKEAREVMNIRARKTCDPDGKQCWVWCWSREDRQRWQSVKPAPVPQDEEEI